MSGANVVLGRVGPERIFGCTWLSGRRVPTCHERIASVPHVEASFGTRGITTTGWAVHGQQLCYGAARQSHEAKPTGGTMCNLIKQINNFKTVNTATSHCRPCLRRSRWNDAVDASTLLPLIVASRPYARCSSPCSVKHGVRSGGRWDWYLALPAPVLGGPRPRLERD